MQELLQAMDVSAQYPKGQQQRAIFCSRTLNLRSIQAIGNDASQVSLPQPCVVTALLPTSI